MSLPLTISGIATDLAAAGPYLSSSGNYYLFAKDATTATKLVCFKATDPESSWSQLANVTGFDTALKDIAGPDPLSLINCGDLIRLVIVDGTGSSANLKYQTFDMGSESFVTQENIASGFAIHQTYDLPERDQFQASIVVRTTGEEVVFFNGAVETVGSKTYSRVYYSRRTGVDTWTTPALVCPAGEENEAYQPAAVLGASDRVHFIYGYFSYLKTRSLSSGNVLDTIQAAGNGAFGSFSAISYVKGTDVRVVAAQASNSGIGQLLGCRFVSQANPTVTYFAVTSTSVCWSVARAYYDNDTATIYFLYRYDPDASLYVIKSSNDGASWGSNAKILTANIDLNEQAMSVNAAPYTTGDDGVLPHIVIDAGTAKYNVHKVSLKHKLIAASGAATAGSVYGTVLSISVPTEAATVAASSLVAAGGEINVNLPAVSADISDLGLFGLGKSGTGVGAGGQITRLGPAGYPIAALAGASGIAATSITLFSANASAIATGMDRYEVSAVLPEAPAQTIAGTAVHLNTHNLAGLAAAGRAGAARPSETVAFSAASGIAASEDIGRGQYVGIDGTAAIAATDKLDIAAQTLLEAATATAAVGDTAPYAFTGTSVALNSAAATTAVDPPGILNESILQSIAAYATENILHLEGDEVFSLPAAAAAGVVGDLLVAIVIPPAIKWLVCASIGFNPELLGDLSMKAELQSTVIAAAALEGSPQLAPAVDGGVELAVKIAGNPAMKEC